MATDQAVLVIDHYERPFEVCVLPSSRASTLGGADADIDVGASAIVATIIPGWRLELAGGGTRELQHGERFQLGACHVQFLETDDAAREADEQRYLRTVVDPVTGAFNRRFVNVHARRIQPPAALLAIDLDRFKMLNDRYGHGIGDRVLSETAARVRARVRWPELVARVGGEELLVVLPQTSLDVAVARAEAMRRAMHEAFVVEGERITSTVSIGVAMLADDFVAALRRADDNLEAAKVQGRDRVVAG